MSKYICKDCDTPIIGHDEAINCEHCEAIICVDCYHEVVNPEGTDVKYVCKTCVDKDLFNN